MRVPSIMRWPGRIPAGRTCDELSSTMDLLPTFARLAGTKAPSDRTIDGKDMWPLMAGRKGAKSPHEAFYYYYMAQLQAVRAGKWKLYLPLKSKKRNQGKSKGKTSLRLFDLKADIHEDKDVSADHSDVVKRLLGLAEKAREDLGDIGRTGSGQRPALLVKAPKPRLMSPTGGQKP